MRDAFTKKWFFLLHTHIHAHSHAQVWSQDSHGRNMLAGYGFCHVRASGCV
jgi:hypothetical protein